MQFGPGTTKCACHPGWYDYLLLLTTPSLCLQNPVKNPSDNSYPSAERKSWASEVFSGEIALAFIHHKAAEWFNFFL